MKKLICILVSVFFVGCGSRKVHVEEYKSGAVISKMEATKSESQSERNEEIWTDIVQYEEINDFEIIADEIIIEDNQGNKKTFKNAVISNKKSKSDANIVKSGKVAKTSKMKVKAKSNEGSKVEQSEKVRDTDRKQFNFTLLIVQIGVALVVLAGAYWLYKRSI